MSFSIKNLRALTKSFDCYPGPIITMGTTSSVENSEMLHIALAGAALVCLL